ncbi:MAG: putative glycoside hydrolase [Bacillota bacterium]|nr:putative glycoside hydrolase [Bacillota bacterium]
MNDRLHRYTGKSNWKKWVIIFILIFILLCATGLYVIGIFDINQKNSKPTQPVTTSENSSTTQNSDQTVQQQPSDTQAGNSSVATEDQTKTSKRPVDLKYQLVTQSEITQGADALIQKAKNGEINSVIIEYKNQLGNVIDSNSDLNEYIKELKDNNLYVIAEVYAFRDNHEVTVDKKSGIMYSKNMLWLDSNNKKWLNPYSESACDYITSVTDSAFAAGADEVMLMECNFPTNGKTSSIYYGDTNGVTKSQCIENFLKTLTQNRVISFAVPVQATKSKTFASSIGLDFSYAELPFVGIYSNDGKELTPIK